MCRREEESHATDAQIALAESGAIDRVDLRVRVDVAHALDVDDHQLPLRRLISKPTEGVRSRAVVVVHERRTDVAARWSSSDFPPGQLMSLATLLGAIGSGLIALSELHEARVVAVLRVIAFDVDLHAEERPRGYAIDDALQLDDEGLQKVDLLRRWRNAHIVLARVALRNHLHLDVHPVHVVTHILEIALGHVIVAVLPVHPVKVRRADLRHLFHSIALAHRAVSKRRGLHLDERLCRAPLVLPNVIVPADGKLRGPLVDLVLHPGIPGVLLAQGGRRVPALLPSPHSERLRRRNRALRHWRDFVDHASAQEQCEQSITGERCNRLLASKEVAQLRVRCVARSS